MQLRSLSQTPQSITAAQLQFHSDQQKIEVSFAKTNQDTLNGCEVDSKDEKSIPRLITEDIPLLSDTSATNTPVNGKEFQFPAMVYIIHVMYYLNSSIYTSLCHWV